VVYFEISVVPEGHRFSCFGYGKVMENQCWKREAPRYKYINCVWLCQCPFHGKVVARDEHGVIVDQQSSPAATAAAAQTSLTSDGWFKVSSILSRPCS